MEENEQTKTNKKSRARGVLIGLAVLLGIVILLGIWQRENLKAMYLTFTGDAESLTTRQEEQTQKRDDVLSQYGLQAPPQKDGQQTEQTQPEVPEEPEQSEPQPEPVPEPKPEPVPEPKPQPEPVPEPKPQPEPEPQPQPEPEPQPEEPEKDEAAIQAEIQVQVDELYRLEDTFKAYIDQLAYDSEHEYWLLPKEEKTMANKLKIVSSKTEALIAAEKDCDAKVEVVISNIRGILEREKMDLALVTEIRTYYTESKANWKAALLTELYS